MDATRAAYLRRRVEQVYSTIATKPQADHPFAIGQALAHNVGYPENLLQSLPATATESFAGVAAVAHFAKLERGATVLDLGCGAGLDALLAAQRVGATGRVVGVDFSAAMVARAHHNAAMAGQTNLYTLRGDAEQLPLLDGAIHTALINGIFNLNPARTAIFTELARVVQPGGAVYAAEIVLRKALSPTTVAKETNWFA